MLEGQKKSKNYLSAILLVSVTFLSYGCAAPARKLDIESKNLNFWKPHLLYLQSGECKSLHVELDAVEGCEPSQETVAALRHFLEQYCEKPESIQIVRNQPIPASDTRVTRPELVSLRHMNMPAPSFGKSASAYLHILFYDSSKLIHKRGRAINPHVQLVPYPSAIYIDTQYVKAHQLADHIPEILIHEVGHVLGLTWSKNTWSHCSNKRCLMYRTYSVNRLAFGKKVAKGLCDKCKRLLIAAQTEEADPRLSFRGPIMVRSEESYHVLALPGFMKLHVGSLDTVNWQDVLQEARTQVSRLAPQPQTVAVMMSQPQQGGINDAQLRLAIASAKKDPCATVRLGMVTLGSQPRQRPGQYKNSQNLLAKWY